jgi:[ribosomal protein S18]-alanine N-acetyltransferase
LLSGNGPSFVIEPFRATDLVSVLKLVQRSLGEEIPYQFFLQMASLRPEYCLTARDPSDNRVLGLIVGTKESGYEGRVLVFAVDPAAQGRGVGRALLRSIQSSMAVEQIRQVHLEVRADNSRAIDFYRRHGFEVTGLQERAYRDGQDAYTMAKPIR